MVGLVKVEDSGLIHQPFRALYRGREPALYRTPKKGPCNFQPAIVYGGFPYMAITHAPTLQEATRTLLKEDQRPLKTISKESRIPYFWLKKFSAGESRSPSVDRTERLYTFLSGKKLPL